ncbi:MAG TPA: hypothetical protein VMH23_11820 [Bacteroidota bacterium]|nr:hypothetical protein [Bacteroidota bacterium]
MKHNLLVCLMCLLLVPAFALAQSEGGLQIFGYYQGQFDQSKVTGDPSASYNTFSLQQMNLLMAKDLTPVFNSFINLQFTSNFNSAMGWGTFNVEEAWVRYRSSDAFNIKAGLLVPTFNNLNDIKTKTPLLPYIMRPLVYESPIASLVTASNFIPERSFVQIYGAVPAGSVKLDYALSLGNSDFITTLGKNGTVSGDDSSTFKSIGGRIGIRTGELKLGVSGTYDRTNPGAPTSLPAFFQGATPIYAAASLLGSVVRIRFGADASYQVAGFSFEGEVISVSHVLTDGQKAILQVLPLWTGGRLYDDLSKLFYYGAVSYDFSEQWYAFTTYGKIQDKFNMVFHSGMNNYGIGGGYRASNSVIIKAQYGRYKMVDLNVANFILDRYSAAVSVFF